MTRYREDCNKEKDYDNLNDLNNLTPRVRSNELRATQEEDLKRGRRMALLHPRFHPATIQELLRFCGISDVEMVLPPEEHKITRHKLGNGRVLVSDSAGGCGIIE